MHENANLGGITLPPPQDDTLREKLEKKLNEYRKRVKGEGKPWEFMHPTLAHKTSASFRDAFYKAEVLQAVLNSTKEKPVRTHELSLDIASRVGNDQFDVRAFSNACGVVGNYLGVTKMPWITPGVLPQVA